MNYINLYCATLIMKFKWVVVRGYGIMGTSNYHRGRDYIHLSNYSWFCVYFTYFFTLSPTLPSLLMLKLQY